MKLGLGLLVLDLGFRFHVSATTVSSIFITWVKLMSRELSASIVWPNRQVKKTLSSCLRRLYPKVRCIIDCFECFTETLSGLVSIWQQLSGLNINIATVEFLLQSLQIELSISYVSSCYGGRASDIFIVRNSGFLNMIEPYDEIMEDRGFKIREDLMMH